MEEVGRSIGRVAFMGLRRAKSLEQGTSLNSFLCLAFFIMFNFLNSFAGENFVNLQVYLTSSALRSGQRYFLEYCSAELKESRAPRGSFCEFAQPISTAREP